jgi:hypothetical protein
MTLMMGKLYTALKAANAPETEAREAAEEAASVHNRLDELDRGLTGVTARIDLLRTELKGEIGALRTEFRGEIRRLEWLVAGLLAIAFAVAGKLFLNG